uniref:AY106269 n=1 Tax=Arundo donax TaxID=35708 RepID=A0A0A9CLS3_ARUDO
MSSGTAPTTGPLVPTSLTTATIRSTPL